MKEGKSQDVGRVPCPGPDVRPYRPFVTFPMAGVSLWIAVHGSVFSHLMHFINNKPYPHRRNQSDCEGCALGQDPRWEGFVGVRSFYTIMEGILKIPAGAYRNCPALQDLEIKGQLRGMLLKCSRIGEQRSKNSPARIVVAPPPSIRKLADKPFDLEAALCRHWGLSSMEPLYGHVPCERPNRDLVDIREDEP